MFNDIIAEFSFLIKKIQPRKLAEWKNSQKRNKWTFLYFFTLCLACVMSNGFPFFHFINLFYIFDEPNILLLSFHFEQYDFEEATKKKSFAIRIGRDEENKKRKRRKKARIARKSNDVFDWISLERIFFVDFCCLPLPFSLSTLSLFIFCEKPFFSLSSTISMIQKWQQKWNEKWLTRNHQSEKEFFLNNSNSHKILFFLITFEKYFSLLASLRTTTTVESR